MKQNPKSNNAQKHVLYCFTRFMVITFESKKLQFISLHFSKLKPQVHYKRLLITRPVCPQLDFFIFAPKCEHALMHLWLPQKHALSGFDREKIKCACIGFWDNYPEQRGRSAHDFNCAREDVQSSFTSNWRIKREPPKIPAFNSITVYVSHDITRFAF